MQPSRIAFRTLARSQAAFRRPLSTSSRTLFKAENDAVTPKTSEAERQHSNIDEWRKTQTERPLNPHMTNTNSANYNEQQMPKVGAHNPPPEFISAVDGDYTPKDTQPENTERMTGGTQPGDPSKVSSSSTDIGVGEMEGAEFKIEPIRRTGEDAATMRARLLCSSTSYIRLLYRTSQSPC